MMETVVACLLTLLALFWAAGEVWLSLYWARHGLHAIAVLTLLPVLILLLCIPLWFKIAGCARSMERSHREFDAAKRRFDAAKRDYDNARRESR